VVMAVVSNCGFLLVGGLKAPQTGQDRAIEGCGCPSTKVELFCNYAVLNYTCFGQGTLCCSN
jgi:hypothetical protein